MKKSTLLSFALVALAAALTGCQNPGASSSASSNAAAASAAAKPNYTIIRIGHPPTSVVVPNGGRLQIVDVGEDRSNPLNKVILDTKVPTNAIVTLNPNGVTINVSPTSATGPYDRRHTFEFRLLQ